MSYLDILPNPTVDMVNAATKVYKESGATSIFWVSVSVGNKAYKIALL